MKVDNKSFSLSLKSINFGPDRSEEKRNLNGTNLYSQEEEKNSESN